MAPAPGWTRSTSWTTTPYHLILLCRNEVGYRNLSALVSRGLYRGVLQQTPGGLGAAGALPRRAHRPVGLPGTRCPGCCWGATTRGQGPRPPDAGPLQVDSYYLEIQDHSIPQQKTVLQGLLRLHQETGIPLVATNDAHYLTREDASIQDVLMCIQMGKTVEDPTGCGLKPRNST